MKLGVDSAFLRRENKLFRMRVKCASCGSEIGVFVNDIASAGEVWPFCERCESYVDVVPAGGGVMINRMARFFSHNVR